MRLRLKQPRGHRETSLYALVAFLLFSAAPAWAIRVDYGISVAPNASHIHVSALIRDDPDTTVVVAMPVWIPGYYHRLAQQTGVSNVAASMDGVAVAVKRASATTWSVVRPPNKAVTIDYDVRRWEYGFSEGDPAWTLGQMGIYIDRHSAFIHPGVACMYLDGHTDAPCTLRLSLPRNWESTAPLLRDPAGVYLAPDYDVLNDSPVQTGRFHRLAFEARGHQFEIITTGQCRVSDAALSGVCKSVAEGAIDLFQGWTPFETYQFHLHFPPKRAVTGAGLEHRSSCVIVFSSNAKDRDFREYGAHLISHEFFHAWNVKAIKPAGLGPFDYSQEARTPSLWMAEGVTDYYSYVAGARAGLWSPESVLKRFNQLVREYRSSPGRLKTSLDDSSLHVWEDRLGRSNGSGGTNYYTKGLLVGWMLDIRIRAATGGRKSLDDAMRWLWRNYAAPNTAYPPDAPLSAIHEATGLDLAGAYAAWVHGTEDLPLNKVLPLAGILEIARPVPNVMLGVNLPRAAGEPRVVTVALGSAADRAGIEPGDVLLKIDGKQVPAGRTALLAGKQREIGDKVPVTVRRRGKAMTVTAVVQEMEVPDLTIDPTASLPAKAVWNGIWASERPGLRQ